MKKKISRVLPILISFILAFTIVTVAWLVQDASVRGLRVTSTTDGVTLKIRMANDSTSPLSDTVDVGMSDLTLKPCVYADGVFYDEQGNVVSKNLQYVRSFSIHVVPEQNCRIRATKTVSGDLPVTLICNGVPVEEYTDLGVASTVATLTFYVYVDGENFNGQSTSDVVITLHGENL